MFISNFLLNFNAYKRARVHNGWYQKHKRRYIKNIQQTFREIQIYFSPLSFVRLFLAFIHNGFPFIFLQTRAFFIHWDEQTHTHTPYSCIHLSLSQWFRIMLWKYYEMPIDTRRGGRSGERNSREILFFYWWKFLSFSSIKIPVGNDTLLAIDFAYIVCVFIVKWKIILMKGGKKKRKTPRGDSSKIYLCYFSAAVECALRGDEMIDRILE